MKTFRTLTLLGAITASTGAQAAAIGGISIYIDWSTLSIKGATITGEIMIPTSFTDPQTGQVFSSDGEGWVGNQSGQLDWVHAIDGASAIASYNDAIFGLVGGYDENGSVAPVPDASGGGVSVSNAGPGVQSGYAGGWHGLFYKATSTDQVTISVDYSLGASVSTNSLSEYSEAGYSVFMDAVDADVWSATYTAAIDSDSTVEEAEIAATEAALLDEYSLNGWGLLNCWGELCNDSTSSSASMSVTFGVVSGTTYAFGADAEASVYTDVNAVPVPAAAWLFGSGLIGLAGIARRK